MRRLEERSHFFALEVHSQCSLAMNKVSKVLENSIEEANLESIGESETSYTTTSNDDFQVVCHGSEICF